MKGESMSQLKARLKQKFLNGLLTMHGIKNIELGFDNEGVLNQLTLVFGHSKRIVFSPQPDPDGAWLNDNIQDEDLG